MDLTDRIEDFFEHHCMRAARRCATCRVIGFGLACAAAGAGLYELVRQWVT